MRIFQIFDKQSESDYIFYKLNTMHLPTAIIDN